MQQSGSTLTQSQFYSTAFNAAIFDGPIRIYFAQYQESLALKIYFRMQEKMQDLYRLAKEIFKFQGQNIFVMLYPTSEIFDLSFTDGKLNEDVCLGRLGEDYVLGVRGPIEDDDFDAIYAHMESIIQAWKNPINA